MKFTTRLGPRFQSEGGVEAELHQETWLGGGVEEGGGVSPRIHVGFGLLKGG